MATSFDDRVAMMQSAVDNSGTTSTTVLFGSHARESMIKEGYLRAPGFPADSHTLNMTRNGLKWSQKMKTAGYITGTPVMPTRQAAVASLPPKVHQAAVASPPPKVHQASAHFEAEGT